MDWREVRSRGKAELWLLCKMKFFFKKKESWRIYFPHSISPSHAYPRSKNITLVGKTIESFLETLISFLQKLTPLQKGISCILPSSCPYLLWFWQTIPSKPSPCTYCCIPAPNCCRHPMLYQGSILPENQSPNHQHQDISCEYIKWTNQETRHYIVLTLSLPPPKKREEGETK